MLEIMINQQQLQLKQQQQQNPSFMSQYSHDGAGVDISGRFSSMDYGGSIASPYLNINTNMTYMSGAHATQDPSGSSSNPMLMMNHLNHAGIIQNSVFSCANSLNKLRAMLTEWCDVVLVENCVYLKFLSSSAKFNRRKLLAIEQENSKKLAVSERIFYTNLNKNGSFIL